MRKLRKPRSAVIAALAAITALVVTACGAGEERGDGDGGGGSEVGVTDTTIKIGAHYPLSGVAAPGYSEIPTGVKAYFDFVNANGGVHGRQLEYVYRDDVYNPTKTSTVVRELVLQDEVFAVVGGLGTPTHSAVLDFLNSNEVPDLFVSSGSLLWDNKEEHPQTFGWQPDYEVEGKIIGRYLKQNMPDKKIGLFLQDDDFGRDGEKGVRAYVDDQIVAAERYTSSDTNIGPRIANLKAAGAEVVIGFTVPSFTALSQLAALQLDYQPQWVYSNVGSDPALVGSLLARFSEGAVKDASMLSGAITTEYMPGVDEPDDPWIQLWNRVWDEHGGEGEMTNYRAYGMAQAYTFVQTLQAAGQDLTREGLVQALEQVGGDLQGPAYMPFRYSADRHAGLGGVKVVRIAGEGSEDLGPVMVTDNGDTEITEHTAEHAPPPESGIPQVEPAG